MTRLGRIATTMNWRYAVGEVVLIVIGVSIALAASSWWDERRDRIEERTALGQIRDSLIRDLGEYEEFQRTHLEQESLIIQLIEHMEGEQPYTRELLPLFRALRRWREPFPNSAAFEALKSRGFDLIVDSDLRQDLINYYGDYMNGLLDSAKNDRDFVVNQLSPYMNDRFITLTPNVLQPIDYESLRRDHRFRNLCMVKLGRLEGYILPRYQDTNKMLRDLISDIDAELGVDEQ